MDVAYWPNFHRIKMSMVFSVVVVVLLSVYQCVATQSTVDNVRRLLSADSGDDQCSLQTSSNYTGHCHCSSLLDIHCTGLDQIPRFVSDNRIFSAINMADQVITEVPESAVDGLQVSFIMRCQLLHPSATNGLYTSYSSRKESRRKFIFRRNVSELNCSLMHV